MASHANVTTLSSAGTSTIIMLNPMARTTTALLNLNSLLGSTGGTEDMTIQVTYDTWYSSGVTQTWAAISTTHYSSAWDTSSVGAGTGTVLTIAGPIAGVRLYSTTWDSTACTAYLKTLQAITAGP